MTTQNFARLARALAFAGTLAFAVAAPVSAQEADSEADPRLAPMSVHYQRLSQAYAEADAAMVLAYRTPDFRIELPGGAEIDYAVAMQSLLDFFAQTSDPEVRTEIQCARMSGEDHAEFVVTQYIGRTQDVDGLQRRVVSAATQTETWRLTPEGWRLAGVSDMHDMRRWVDGVEVDPARPYNASAAPFTPTFRSPDVCGG